MTQPAARVTGIAMRRSAGRDRQGFVDGQDRRPASRADGRFRRSRRLHRHTLPDGAERAMTAEEGGVRKHEHNPNRDPLFHCL